MNSVVLSSLDGHTHLAEHRMRGRIARLVPRAFEAGGAAAVAALVRRESLDHQTAVARDLPFVRDAIPVGVCLKAGVAHQIGFRRRGSGGKPDGNDIDVSSHNGLLRAGRFTHVHSWFPRFRVGTGIWTLPMVPMVPTRSVGTPLWTLCVRPESGKTTQSVKDRTFPREAWERWLWLSVGTMVGSGSEFVDCSTSPMAAAIGTIATPFTFVAQRPAV